ncbi:predicted Zn-dependent peptidase [Bacillus oleivorans]|uniref:Predicted Zn-dependent peptidase n=1 Tax=Bacillus oleivorans TaxID=1448271 RepID=A0A285D6V3_9BACI|nr:pitrilysin family protein [Bacillus oleivorans]SNX75365.1 predicted Zn-dependent peptidase [Bacillus oleivorans]
MEKIPFQQLKEELYYEKLDNGLDVYILPKQGFNKTYATFTTNYGSIDNHFVPLGKQEFRKVPDGIAHFLEHKMFEKEDGDVFQQFSRQGASANAFTTFTRTAYLFSSTSNVEQNLETLINFVQEPYFSEETVEKEKGIIGQEITMYDDNPDWRLYFGAIESMYHNHPVKLDIAGTIESIAKITKDDLYECYETFYHPSNMLLFVVGPVDPNETLVLIKNNQAQKEYKEQPPVQREFAEEPDSISEKVKVLHMNVQSEKCMVGVKDPKTDLKGEALQKHEQTVQVLMDMLFGKSSENYKSLYEQGLIDDSFSYDYSHERGYGFALVGSDTKDADALLKALTDILLQAKSGNNLTEEALNRSKKKKIGGFLRAMNSPEYIANQFTRYRFNEMDLFTVLNVLESIQLNDIKQVAADLIDESKISACHVLPMQNA